jgi:hypothetical protein
MCIMCALMRLSLSLSLLCSPSWSKCARFVISSSSTVLRCSFSEGKSAATLCVLLQSAHLPCMYTRERGACERERALNCCFLLSAPFLLLFTFANSLCVCVCVCAALDPLSQPGAGIQLSGKLILRFAFMHRAVVVVALSAKGLSVG